jgi:hypothetical protein
VVWVESYVILLAIIRLREPVPAARAVLRPALAQTPAPTRR